MIPILLFAASEMLGTAFAQQGVAPDFEGKAVSGETFHLASVAGRKMVVLNFFTSWCGPCQVEIPELNRLQTEHGHENLQVVGIDVQEGLPTVQAFVQRMKFTFPVLVDSGALKTFFGITGFPYTVVVGVDGMVQYQALGVVSVETTLMPLLRKNEALLKSNGAITEAKYLSSQKPPGSAIHLAAPEVKPVAALSSGANEIFGIKVVRDDPKQIEVEIDYHYAGDHGDQRIYVDCMPDDGKHSAPYGMLPGRVEVGRHTTRAPLSSYDKTPDGAVSTEIHCEMNSRIDGGRLTTKTVPFRKVWKR